MSDFLQNDGVPLKSKYWVTYPSLCGWKGCTLITQWFTIETRFFPFSKLIIHTGVENNNYGILFRNLMGCCLYALEVETERKVVSKVLKTNKYWFEKSKT